MFHKIMVAVDLMYEDLAVQAATTALNIGGLDAHYQLVTVIMPINKGFVASFLPRDYEQQVTSTARDKLHAFRAAHFPKDANVQHVIAHGTIYEEINRLANEQDVDLIVMNATKPNGRGLGPNAARVARNSNKTVMVVR